MKTDYLHSLPASWEKTSTVFAALGDMTRQRILLLYEPGEELSIKEIAEQFKLGRSTIVHHLAVLERAGFLKARKQGRESLYSLSYAPVLEAIEGIRLYIKNHLHGNPDI